MRTAKSYSIVDHVLLHGGYLHRLSHEALSLYLFLVVVGDQDGKSYYGERTISEILRLKGNSLAGARCELVDEGLICFRSPYFWVKSLKRDSEKGRTISESEDQKQHDEERLRELLKQLKLMEQEE